MIGVYGLTFSSPLVYSSIALLTILVISLTFVSTSFTTSLTLVSSLSSFFVIGYFLSLFSIGLATPASFFTSLINVFGGVTTFVMTVAFLTTYPGNTFSSLEGEVEFSFSSLHGETVVDDLSFFIYGLKAKKYSSG